MVQDYKCPIRPRPKLLLKRQKLQKSRRNKNLLTSNRLLLKLPLKSKELPPRRLLERRLNKIELSWKSN
jgi:hypothetical protein